ncbi:cation:proton antiporter [Novosphingobium aquae]|uniref:Cation:proton antiporter n=1 Tax=Novosphingobium aquae TaxID=3133435 RepID=A0ABU8S6X1_9SPHN
MASPIEFAPNTPLGDALVILGAAGLVIPLFARFRITPVIGFILVGMLVGPFGLGAKVEDIPWLSYVTISDPGGLAPWAEFGIVMLLFSVGLELSFGRLWTMRRLVFGLGALELIIGALLIGAVLFAMGNSLATGLALGLALALSSTALVLKITDTRTPVGRAALSMLLFEDIALVPIIFLLGAMGSGGEGADIWRTLMIGGLTVGALMVGGRLFLPILFAQAARTKSPELFLAASLLVVIVAALATAASGLSPIVGALIAGLLIAETDYAGEVESMTEPFKGLALGVFLITVGMSLDLDQVWNRIWEVTLAVVAVLGIKAVVTGTILRMMGARTGMSTETGILMASPSETTLIVLGTATSVGLINSDAAQFWQIVTALGLTITPLLAKLGKRLGRRIDRAAPATEDSADDTVPRAIIIGFGRVGRMVADMLRNHDKPFIALDADADIIAQGARDGYPVVFGDAARGGVLSHLHVDRASAVILTMDEPYSMQRLVRNLRGQYPDLPIIARARDASHAALLYKAGASHAVPETLESSLQLSEAVLVDLGVPMGFVIASIHEKRDEFRAQIMVEGGLDEKPKLKSASMRERVAE